MSRILWLFLSVLILWHGESPAQVKLPAQQLRMQLQLAQRFEAMGNYESALAIYKELHGKQPRNYTYFDGVARCLANLKRHNELIAFVQQQILKDPNNFQYKVRLGDAYFRSGKEEKARRIWADVIKAFPKNPSVYRAIANAWISNRNFDEAIKTYLEGRKAIGDPSYFSLELAQWYAYRMDYKKATEEYLNFLKRNPHQRSYVEARLASFKGNFDTYQQVTQVLQKWIEKEKNCLPYCKLMVSFLISYEDYEGAFRQVLKIESLKPQLAPKDKPGLDLWQFGNVILSERQYELAEKVFREILNRYPTFYQKSRVEYSLARALYSQQKYKKAVQLFQKIVKRYPKTQWALESSLKCATAWLEKLGKPDSARAVLEEGLKLFAKNERRVLLWLRLADVNIYLGDLAAAQKNLAEASKVAVRDPNLRKNIRIESQFKQAELAFYRKDFSEAAQILRTLLEPGETSLSNDLVNDALDLLMLIEENQTTVPEALSIFAQAKLLSKQNHKSKAGEMLFELANTYPDVPLAPRALFESGRFYEESGDFLRAIERLSLIPERYAESTLSDEALWRVAQIYENDLKNNSKAIEHYEKILLRYPNSLWAEPARKKIRELEGKS